MYRFTFSTKKAKSKFQSALAVFLFVIFRVFIIFFAKSNMSYYFKQQKADVHNSRTSAKFY